MTMMLAFLAFCTAFSTLLMSWRTHNHGVPSAVGAEELLEGNLESFLSHLETDIDHLREMAPGFAVAFTELALTVLVLEYVLRDRGLVQGKDLKDALRTALAIVEKRRRGLRSMQPVGHA